MIITLDQAPLSPQDEPALGSPTFPTPPERWTGPTPVAPAGNPRRTILRALGVFGLGLLACLLVVTVLFTPFLGCGVDRSHTHVVQANLNTVRLALEQYASDHDGRYPPSGCMVAELTRDGRNYLPGNHLPTTPWSQVPQTVAITTQGTDLPSASQIAAKGEAPAPGLVVGRGEAGAKGPDNAYQYGAIVYELDPDRQVYVLYGVGQSNKSAKAVAVLTNL